MWLKEEPAKPFGSSCVPALIQAKDLIAFDQRKLSLIAFIQQPRQFPTVSLPLVVKNVARGQVRKVRVGDCGSRIHMLLLCRDYNDSPRSMHPQLPLLNPTETPASSAPYGTKRARVGRRRRRRSSRPAPAGCATAAHKRRCARGRQQARRSAKTAAGKSRSLRRRRRG